MKYSIPVKFFALFLTALALVFCFGSAAGILQVIDFNLYTQSFNDWLEDRLDSRTESIAADLLSLHVIPLHSNCSENELGSLGYASYMGNYYMLSQLNEEDYSFVIYDQNGHEVTRNDTILSNGYQRTYTSDVRFPVLVTDEAAIDAQFGTDYRYADSVYLSSFQKEVTVRYYGSPAYTVDLTILPEAMLEAYGTSLPLIQLLYQLRYMLLVILAISLAVFAIGFVYLCCAAGHSPKSSQVVPGGLNRLPLDLYLLCGGIAFALLLSFIIAIAESWYYSGYDFNTGTLVITALLLFCAACIVLGFLFAVAAQFKLRNFYWFRHSIIGWCFGKLWLGLKYVFRFFCRLFYLLPLVWKWILIAAGMAFVFMLGILVAYDSSGLFFLLMIVLGCIAVVLYGAYAYGTLLTGAQRMAEGDLNTKINTKYLIGSYAQCARHLNTLADVAVVAAKNQMKSDRMKTELITNVSHDIKTPLTSIINYIDLLEKPHTPEQEQQYLEVLGRQSQQMKKLIEDLMEMSKATTGNLSVDITRVDATEAVTQALGEFSDKLNTAALTPVFRHPEETVAIQADGRLTWRVLSNLLSNVVKYTLPGTRVYIDLVKLENQVVISLKNISREELNISADELTERFVRGDASRNTEGSGLGLNIAKSLMELQKGQLQLLVDGDLFKVTLVFPVA